MTDQGQHSGTILLFGMPRSGTTWLGKIFDSHSATLYRHEPDSWRRLDTIPLMPSMANAAAYADAIRQFETELPGFNAAKVCSKQPLFPKRYLTTGHLAAIKVAARVAQLGERAGLHVPVMWSPTRRPPGARLVWKSIESLGRLGVILVALPEARAIHILRHPCGFVASVLRGERKQKFEDNQGASEDYGVLEMLLQTSTARELGLSMDRMRAVTPEERLAWRWALSTEKAIVDTRDTGRCKLVRYEDLCEDPLQVATAMFEFAGLDLDRQTRAFLGASVTRQDDSYYSVFKNPAAVVNRWRHELDEQQVGRILRVAESTSSGRLFACAGAS